MCVCVCECVCLYACVCVCVCVCVIKWGEEAMILSSILSGFIQMTDGDPPFILDYITPFLVCVYSPGKPLIENETDVTLITVSVGHALELFCGAYGYPQPVVTWFKDSYSSIPITETGGVILTADGKLIVLHTKADDSGVYYCVSENSLDYIKRRFRVNVK